MTTTCKATRLLSIVLMLAPFAVAHDLSAQVSTFFALPGNQSSAGAVDIFITSGVAASGTISNTAGTFNMPFNVPANGTDIITINNLSIQTEGVVSTTGAFLIDSTEPIAANVMDANTPVASNDITNLLPASRLGTSHRILATGSNIVTSGSQVTVLAPEDNTTVTINPSVSLTTGEPAGVPFNVNLNAGQLVQFTTNGIGDIITGSFVAELASIKTNKPAIVGQYMTGAFAQPVDRGDPAFSLVPHTNQLLDKYVINVPTLYPDDFVNIAVSETAAASVTIDGVPIDTTMLGPIPGTGLVGGNIPVSDGSHVIEADEEFMVLQHGLNESRASYFGIAGSKTSGGGLNQPPEVDDDFVMVFQGETVDHTFTGSDPDGDPLTWEFVSLTNTGLPDLDPSFDPDTQRFVWDTTGSEIGLWMATVRATDPDLLSGEGVLTIQVKVVPEPAGIALSVMGLLALVGFGFRLRRKARP